VLQNALTLNTWKTSTGISEGFYGGVANNYQPFICIIPLIFENE